MRRTIKTLSILASLCSIGYLIFESIVLKENILVPSIITGVFIVLLIGEYLTSKSQQDQTSKAIETGIESAANEALDEGSIGILVYNDEFEITWMSPFFKKREIDKVGDKVLTFIPELQDLLQGTGEHTNVTYDKYRFSISRKDNSTYLIFIDTTNEYILKKKIADSAYVLGMLNYDNYDEYRENDDEVALINSNIKVPVIDYLKKYNVVYKTLRTSKMMLILNEKSYAKLVDDKFSILNIVRNESKKLDFDITLSMSFARGSNNLDELDDEAQELLQLAQTRGGDQVVSRKLGEDAVFFGGSSEAKESRSRVKIRVITNSIKDLVNKASNVIIVGHKDMDADCVGAAICMSNFVSSLNKSAHIVMKNVSIDPMINDVLNKYSDVLVSKHHFLSEQEALALLDSNSLMIMVDHHLASQSNCSDLLKKANNIIIVDHHRRHADLDINPLMIYLEAGASSTCELVSEFISYLPKKFSLKDEEANIMYLGILIDTDHFRVRTGSRTFDAAKLLKEYGADPLLCDELSQESFELFNAKTMIVNNGKRYANNIIISSLASGNYNRTIASKACDNLVKVKGIDAAFVICNSDNNEVIVSARSNGKINVQTILEKMNGGGHMTAAGLQRKDTSVIKVEKELVNVLDAFFKGENTNESNTIE